MVRQLFGERERLAYQTGNPLSQSIVEAFDVIGFPRVLRDGFMPLYWYDPGIGIILIRMEGGLLPIDQRDLDSQRSGTLATAISGVKGDRFRRVELEQSARWGLLGKGAVLMAAAYPNRTSPVLRGAFILKHLQGVPPANPPMNVPTLDEKDIGTTRALTVREMIARHRANPTCASCHAVMDPLGLALENFDATGRWRDRDRYAGAAIDASGELPDGTPINGPDDLRKALLGRPGQFAQTFTEGLLTYATGRKLEHYDMPTVRRIVRGASGSDYRFSALVQAVVQSEQFRMRRVGAAGGPGGPGGPVAGN